MFPFLTLNRKILTWCHVNYWLKSLPSKHLLALKTSSTRLQRNNFTSSKTSRRRLENFLKTSSRRLGRWKIITLKTSSRRLEEISWRSLQTSWRQTKCLLGIYVSNKSKCVSNKSIFRKSISDKSKVNPKCVT